MSNLFTRKEIREMNCILDITMVYMIKRTGWSTEKERLFNISFLFIIFAPDFLRYMSLCKHLSWGQCRKFLLPYVVYDCSKSVRNRYLIELFCGVVCVVTLPF